MMMRRTFRLKPFYLAYWTVAAVLIGALLAPALTEVPQQTASADHHGPAHTHKTMEVDPAHVPALTVSVEEDLLNGWNVFISVERFTFAPDMVNQGNLPNHGHAHLYLNGRKVTRLYGPAFHLSEVPSGRNTVTVTLNANDHSDLVSNGEPIMAQAVFDNGSNE